MSDIGWMDKYGRTSGWINRWKDTQVDRCGGTNGWIDRQGRMNGWMDK